MIKTKTKSSVELFIAFVETRNVNIADCDAEYKRSALFKKWHIKIPRKVEKLFFNLTENYWLNDIGKIYF